MRFLKKFAKIALEKILLRIFEHKIITKKGHQPWVKTIWLLKKSVGSDGMNKSSVVLDALISASL